MSLTLTDLFCGAGGSAQGAHVVPGIELRLAANHWKLAVESHAENFPHADHLVADISQVDPRRVPKTDLLWASPECTNHSQAKGVKRYSQPDLFGETLPSEAVERSRATMWDVPRFAEQHAYSAIVVENVVDAAKWVMWDAWLMAMTSLGYAHQLVSLNSMHASAAEAPRAPAVPGPALHRVPPRREPGAGRRPAAGGVVHVVRRGGARRPVVEARPQGRQVQAAVPLQVPPARVPRRRRRALRPPGRARHRLDDAGHPNR